MSEEVQKIKVIEFVGTKLDPNAKYLFVFNSQNISNEKIEKLRQEIYDTHGLEIVVASVLGNPSEAIKVYEIPRP